MSKNAVMPLSDYVSVCDKIREKTETTETIKSGELSEKINKVYEAGHTQGEREMWDGITNYNTRTDYEKTFADSSYEYITPPYKIYPKYKRAANQTFIGAKRLKKLEAKCFDFSQKEKGTGNDSAYYYTFYDCSNLEEIEDIGMQADYGYSTTFANCIKLKKIACVRSDENTLYNGEVFNFCYALEEVRFEGVIGQNGLNLSRSKNLSKESILNIIGCLKDFRQPTTFTVDVLPITHTTITNGALEDGKEYTWSYYDSQFPGWVTGDDATAAPSEEEVWITSTAGKVVIGGNEYIGFKANWLCYPFPDDSPYVVYVYQDGSEIKVYAEVNGVNDYIKIILNEDEAPITRTITFGTDNLNKLTDAEKAIATQKGWSLV